MESLLRDLRLAARGLAKRPGFTAIALATLAIGIGANAAMFTVLNAVLFRPLPFPEPEQLMRLFIEMPEPGGTGVRDITFSYPKYRLLAERQQVFQTLTTFRATRYDLVGYGPAQQLDAELIGAGYLEMLGIQPVLGRGFTEEEFRTEGAAAVALLSHGLWVDRFGRDPAVVGRSIELSDRSFQVVGILPEGFEGLTGGARAWVPTVILGEGELSSPRSHNQHVLARLKDDVTPDQAKAAVAALGAQIDEVYPAPRGASRSWGAGAVTLNEERVDPVLRGSLLLLGGAVGFVLLIACVNLANLLLARASARGREVAIRRAVGANRRDLVRQLLVESALLSCLGGIVGLVIAFLSLDVLRAIAPEGVGGDIFRGSASGLSQIGLDTIHMDTGVIIFTFAAIVLTVFLFGLGPAVWASRSDILAIFHGDGRRNSGSVRSPIWSGRSGLVVTEVALTFVLLMGAGLTLKSLSQILATDVGYSAEGVWTGNYLVTSRRYPAEAVLPFHEEVMTRVAALPGVVSVGVNHCTPLSPGCQGTDLYFPDGPEPEPGEAPLTGLHRVSSDYFRTLGTPITRGRAFDRGDRAGSPDVAIISRTIAERFFPGRDAIGQRIRTGSTGERAFQVVGVADDILYESLTEDPELQVYIPIAQIQARRVYLAVRTSTSAADLTQPIRRILAELDPQMPLTDVTTMEVRVRRASSNNRFAAHLLMAFSVIALALAAIGVYGVMAFDVQRRTKEIGLRMALGARKEGVLQQVLKRSLTLAVLGSGVGLAVSLALGRVIASGLYGVEPHDPILITWMLGVILAVAGLASAVPALRAASVQPYSVLRES